MQTLDFFKAVLPQSGRYVCTIIPMAKSSHRRRNIFCDTLEELTQACIENDLRKNNVYFAVASYKNDQDKRTQQNVFALKSFFVDIDCGANKPYATKKDGLVALVKFIKSSGLPQPMIVDSGGGIHAYWLLTAEISPVAWERTARAFKKACFDRGLEIDKSRTADSASVMRPAGMTNKKNGNVVKVLAMGQPMDYATFAKAFPAGAIDGEPPVMTAAKGKSTIFDDAVAGLSSSLPVSAKKIYTLCQQVREAADNQATTPEPLWYALLGIAAYCEDPEDTARRWSCEHPDYSAAETIKKMHQWKEKTTGATTCAMFEDLNPGGCEGCKYKGRITSPIRLGIKHEEVKLKLNEEADVVAVVTDLPKPYKRTASGIKTVIDDVEVDVCPFDLYAVSYGFDDKLGYEVVRFRWNRPHIGWSPLTIRRAHLMVGGREFMTSVADQGVLLPSVQHVERFIIMLRRITEELQNAHTTTDNPSRMGWRRGNTEFVIGRTIYMRAADGTVFRKELDANSPALKQADIIYGTKGTAENWTKFTSLVDKANMLPQMFALNVGFSTPLYMFSGIKGILISFYGPTGGGKTLAQRWVQSIYGNPEELDTPAKFTQNYIFNRLGFLHNLPMTVDELTLSDPKMLGDMIYWITQGKDKARLTKDIEHREQVTWATPIIASTNKSLADKLAGYGSDVDAQFMRVLEVPVKQNDVFRRSTDAGRLIYSMLQANYGHVGRAYIKHLLTIGPEALSEMVAKAAHRFSLLYNTTFSGEERFWETAIALSDLGAQLAKQAGLIDYDYTRASRWIVNCLPRFRQTVIESRRSHVSVLVEYLNEIMDRTLTVTYTDSQGVIVDAMNAARNGALARFELIRATPHTPVRDGLLHIDRTWFQKWVRKNGYDYAAFAADLIRDGVIVNPRALVSLAKDTPIKLPKTEAVTISLKHPAMHAVLDEQETKARQHLAAVK